jgi:arsenate reductase
MAEAFCRVLGKDVECESAGSSPAEVVAPNAVAVMKEIGADYLVSMGCTVTCPFLPGAKEIRWEIPDPFGKGPTEYRRVRGIIRTHVHDLLDSLGRLASHPLDNRQPLT